MRARAVLAAVALGVAPGPAAALAIDVTAPEAGGPVFGRVEVRIEVEPRNEVRWVELFVDGLAVGRLQAPPFRFSTDVGDQNASHRFEVVAADRAGAVFTALLVTPAIPIDDRIEVELQQLYVTVSRDGRRVLDLRRHDFTVLDDGAEQDLVTFERGEVPCVAVLLVDSSLSMRGLRLDGALAGVRAFTSAMADLDEAKVLLFSDRVLHTTPFASFAPLLGLGLSSVAAGGATALNDHLYLALGLLEQRQGRRVVVLLSDGVDVASVLSMRQVLDSVRRSRSMIYWIRPGASDAGSLHQSSWRDAAGHRREREQLERAVELSGGRVVSMPSILGAEAAFAEILRDIREQYVLGFYPREPRGDGSWHRVRVRVPAGLKVRAREGYVDL